MVHRRLGRLVPALVGVVGALTASTAGAQSGPYQGTRLLGTGGAMRAASAGDVSPLINPAGMAMIQAYHMIGGYQYLPRDQGHAFHAALVDSTSAFGLAGALSYTYVNAEPSDMVHNKAHDMRLALAVPVGEKAFLGATGKYFKVTSPASESGFSVDAGLIVRPLPSVAAALVGYDLLENDATRAYGAMRSVGAGVAVGPVPELTLAADVTHTFATAATNDEGRTGFAAGGEYLLARRIGLRAGGGYDGVGKHGHAGAGLSLISDDFAIDIGFRQDLSGDDKASILGVGLRAFVPAPVLK